MKKITPLLLLIMIASYGFAQHCYDSINFIPPAGYTTPGFAPDANLLACHQSGDTYYDTIYFHNYSTIAGLAVSSLTIDSIENLPTGLCWNTNKASNTFGPGENGVILISGTGAALPGQYKLRIKVDLIAGGLNLYAVDLEQVSGLRYYLKVACSNGTCLPVDTVQGQYNSFIPYTSGCTMGTAALTASITSAGYATFCAGGSDTLKANEGAGYTYRWSIAPGIVTTRPYMVATAAGSYDVTVYNATDSAVSAPVTISVVTTCQNSGHTGFSPGFDVMPCITAGQPVNDTIYFINYTTFSGQTVNYLKFDSISNLPSGLSWSTNKPGNTFLGGDSGFVVISGVTSDSSGQYRLQENIDMSFGSGYNMGMINNATANGLFGLTYYLKVACAGGGCLPVDTTQGQYYPFVPYTPACAVSTVHPTATITASGSTTICQGSSVTLTATAGPYNYYWSTGATSQSIVVDSAATVTVMVYNAIDSAVSGPVTVSVTNCQLSGAAGFSPSYDALPCLPSGQFIVDTIHFHNYATISGLAVNSLKIDSISNLPAGLSWSTDQNNNTFLGGDSGQIIIYGTTLGAAGQYQLNFTVDLNATALSLSQVNLQSLTDDRYYLRVSCSNGSCLTVDTTLGAFAPNTSCPPASVVASVTASTTGFCYGNSANLTVNANVSSLGYTYLWSTGDTSQSINVTASGFYTVTATYGGATATDSSPYIIADQPVVAAFTLVPDPTTPHVWDVVNQCSGNLVSYIWNWGDSTTATGATPTHTYSNAGYYTICVSVADSMGCTAAYCDTNAYLFKVDNQMIQVSVVQYATGINDIGAKAPVIKYYANAVHFSEAIQSPADIRLYDISGRVVMSQDRFTGQAIGIGAGIADGVYIIHVQGDSFTTSQRLMIIR